LCLNELLRASCPPPFGPAELFKFIPDEFVRENLAALGNCSLRCSITGTPDRYIHVGDLDRSPLIHSYCYASAGDQSTFADRDVGARAMQEQLAAFAIFPLIFVPFMQHAS